MTQRKNNISKVRYGLAAILAVVATTVASYAHGRGDNLDGSPDSKWFETKGVIMVLHALILTVACFIIFPHWSSIIIAIFTLVLFWFTFRTSSQSHPELDSLASPTESNITRCRKAYYRPVGVCVIISLVCLFVIQANVYAYISTISLLGTVFASPSILRIVNYNAKIGKKLLDIERAKKPSSMPSGCYNRMATELAVTLFCSAPCTVNASLLICAAVKQVLN